MGNSGWQFRTAIESQPVIVYGNNRVGVLYFPLGNIARARGMAQLAKETGLTREGLYKALSKISNPSFSTVLKVMKALGLKLTPQAA